MAAYLFFTEWNTTSSTTTSSMLFKRGTTSPVLEEATADEEKGKPVSEKAALAPSRSNDASADKALEGTMAMKDVFTWQHLEYTVPVGGGNTRRLLDDVSGYVAPGKLTAREYPPFSGLRATH